jgi:hypothetical protein
MRASVAHAARLDRAIHQPEELREKQQPTGECVEVERQPPEELQQPPNERLEQPPDEQLERQLERRPSIVERGHERRRQPEPPGGQLGHPPRRCEEGR